MIINFRKCKNICLQFCWVLSKFLDIKSHSQNAPQLPVINTLFELDTESMRPASNAYFPRGIAVCLILANILPGHPFPSHSNTLRSTPQQTVLEIILLTHRIADLERSQAHIWKHSPVREAGEKLPSITQIVLERFFKAPQFCQAALNSN